MDGILLFILVYVIIFSFYMIYFAFRKKSNKKMIEITYLERKYKVDLSKMNKEIINKHIATINSFILTVVIFVMSNIDQLIFRVLFSFIIIVILILLLYKILIEYYKSKI